MKEHTIALLTECEAGLKMATGSMEQTLPKLSDPGFKTMFQDYYTKHAKLQEECKRQLKEQQKEEDRWLQYGNEDDRKMLKQIYAGIRREHIACAEGH